MVSIIVNNHNYADFLPVAIESALAQTYAPVEVVVVDDGSTDRSRDVIAGYGGRIRPVLKSNGGQASAFNAGVAASRGEILCLLDADDLFHPDKVGALVEAFRAAGDGSRGLFVSHFLDLVDEAGAALPGRMGSKARRRRDVYDYARRYRYTYAPSGPTSGFCFNQVLAGDVFPLPETGLKVGADDFVRRAASLIAECRSLDRVLASYRVHGHNRWYGTADEQTGPLAHVEQLEAYLNDLLRRSGREPVICFRESMYFAVYLADRGAWAAAAGQMARALCRHPDPHTLRFAWMLLRNVIRRRRATRAGTPRSAAGASVAAVRRADRST